MSELDVIGAITGTDKSSSVSWAWDYLRHYEELFARWRGADINLIEIGVAGGASLEAWLKYFERARMVGIDINPDAVRYAGARVEIRVGSQEDPGFLHRVAAEFPPTIVIDDGSHVAHHMIASFEALFPALLPGGLYIFEDLAFHFDESARRFQDAVHHQGLADQPIFDYLNKFVRARAASVAIPDASWGFARYAFEHIDSVYVACGFIAVRKVAPRDFERDIAQFEAELAGAGGGRHRVASRYAEYLLKHETRLDRAADLLAEAVAAAPGDEAALTLLVATLVRLGRLDEASEAGNRLVRVAPGNAVFWDQLSGVERRRNRPDLEIVAMRRLVALQPGMAGYAHRLSELHQDLGDMAGAVAAARRARELEPGNPHFVGRAAALEGL